MKTTMVQRLISAVAIILSTAFVLWNMTGVASLETEYSPGFSEAAWRSIEPGMSTAAVVKSLGKPLDISNHIDNTPSKVLHYAKNDSKACVIRYVVVNKEGVVTDVVSDIHQLD